VKAFREILIRMRNIKLVKLKMVWKLLIRAKSDIVIKIMKIIIKIITNNKIKQSTINKKKLGQKMII